MSLLSLVGCSALLTGSRREPMRLALPSHAVALPCSPALRTIGGCKHFQPASGTVGVLGHAARRRKQRIRDRSCMQATQRQRSQHAVRRRGRPPACGRQGAWGHGPHAARLAAGDAAVLRTHAADRRLLLQREWSGSQLASCMCWIRAFKADPAPMGAGCPQMLRGYPVLVGLTFGVSFFIVPSFMIFIRSTQPPEGSRARLYGVP